MNIKKPLLLFAGFILLGIVFVISACSGKSPQSQKPPAHSDFKARLTKVLKEIAEDDCSDYEECYLEEGEDYIESEVCQKSNIKNDGFSSIKECLEVSKETLKALAKELDLREGRSRRRSRRRSSRRRSWSSGTSSSSSAPTLSCYDSAINLDTTSVAGACPSPSTGSPQTGTPDDSNKLGDIKDRVGYDGYYQHADWKRGPAGSTSVDQKVIVFLRGYTSTFQPINNVFVALFDTAKVEIDEYICDTKKHYYLYLDGTRYEVKTVTQDPRSTLDSKPITQARITKPGSISFAPDSIATDYLLPSSAEDRTVAVHIAKKIYRNKATCRAHDGHELTAPTIQNNCRFFTPNGHRDTGTNTCPSSNPGDQYKLSDFTFTEYGAYMKAGTYSVTGDTTFGDIDPSSNLILRLWFLSDGSTHKQFIALNGNLISFGSDPTPSNKKYFLYVDSARTIKRYPLKYLSAYCPSNNILHTYFEIEGAGNTRLFINTARKVWIAEEKDGDCIYYKGRS